MGTRISNTNQRSIKTSFKCIQINCRKAYVPTKETINYILKENIDIAFVSEPYLINDNMPANISPITCLHYKTPNNRIRAIIYINNNKLNPILIQQYSDSCFCVVDVSLNGKTTRLMSVYRPPDSDSNMKELIDKMEQALPTTSNHRTIIAGDFNAHHKEWGCQTSDANGQELYDFLLLNDLNLCNEGNIPTHVQPARNISSIIDLTMASTDMNIERWKVNPDAILGSDHNTLEFFIKEVNNQPQSNNIRQSTYRYRTDQANWEILSLAFRTEMDRNDINEQTINNLNKPEEIDVIVNQITEIITIICDKELKKRGQFIVKKCPWWDDELDQLKKLTIQSKHTYQNAKNNNEMNQTIQQKLQIHLEHKRKYAKCIRQKSNASFTKYLQSCQGMPDIKKVNKLLADTTTTKFPTTLIVNGISTTDHESNTYIMGFSKAARTINVNIANQNLEMKNQIKYLGIIIDQQLNFKAHADHVVKKLAKFYNMFSRIIRPNWGLNPEISALVYRMVAEPMALYGASIWHKTTETKKIAQRILSVQRRILIKICRGYRTISYTSVFLVNNTIPIDIKINERAKIERAKMLDVLKPDGEQDIKLEKLVPATNLPHPGLRNKTTYLIKMNHQEIDRCIMNDGLSIFTDGSKMNNHTGAACVITRNGQLISKHKWKLANHCSVYQAELTAIKESLKQSHQYDSNVIQIFSDSRSSLEAINDRLNCHPIVVEINEEIDLLRTRGKSIRLHWVKAHSNYRWNEVADELAKEATLEESTNITYDRMPISTYKFQCRQTSNEEWMARTTKAETGKWTKKLIPDAKTADAVQRKC
ncbi:hypothetical protein BLA29_001461, partial [Euroglyphus maynei]